VDSRKNNRVDTSCSKEDMYTEVKWEGDVREDMGRMKIQNWGKKAVDREAWKRNVESDRTHEELWCQKKKKGDLRLAFQS